MGTAASPFIEGLVFEEIRRLVAEAAEDGDTVSTADCVKKVRTVYPRCGISKSRITDEVITAATRLGIPVEIGKAKPKKPDAAT